MGDVVPFSATVLRCPKCDEPMRQDEEANYRCQVKGCGAGRITSPTGVKITRRGGYTIIEPRDPP